MEAVVSDRSHHFCSTLQFFGLSNSFPLTPFHLSLHLHPTLSGVCESMNVLPSHHTLFPFTWCPASEKSTLVRLILLPQTTSWIRCFLFYPTFQILQHGSPKNHSGNFENKGRNKTDSQNQNFFGAKELEGNRQEASISKQLHPFMQRMQVGKINPNAENATF